MEIKSVCTNGSIKPTNHKTIMERLRIQAERFRKQGRLRDKDLEEVIAEIKANDRTAEGDADKTASSASDKENRRVMEAVEEGLLQVHGTAPNTNLHGVFRILGENCNGFNNRIGGNNKIAKALDIKEDLGIECLLLLYCKHRLNFRHKDNKNDLKQMCTTIGAHNRHEARIEGRVQEGGTGSICFGDTVGYVKKKGKDKEGLGRWCWVLLGGNNGHQTRIISAYNPCKNKKVNSGTTYQQQRRYFITQKKDLTCPRTLFRRNLIKQIKSCRESGDKSYYSWITTNTLPTGHWEKSSAIGMGLT
jgi:ribosomal protein L12E/L44/L45/RPP1/RPP2